MSEFDENELLQPQNSPSQLNKHFGVRRVNNLPIILIGAAIAAFFIIMMLVAVDRANNGQADAAEAKKPQADSTALAESITGGYNGAMIIPPVDTLELPPPLGNEEIILSADLSEQPDISPPDPDEENIRRAKMQLFENAIRSKTAVPFNMDSTNINNKKTQTLQRIESAQSQIAALQNDTSSNFMNRMAQLKGEDGGNISSSPKLLELSDTIDVKPNSGGWELNSAVEPPKTPYVLRAGFVIPSTMISGINSDLPGQIIGQVSQNVYDSASGKYLLIPQGTRLVGSYSSNVLYGQERIMIAWQRLIFPDGKAMDIGAMPGADGLGYAGATDEVNNHYFRLFASAFLMSGITAGISYSQDRDNGGYYSQPNMSSALSEALGQQFGNVTGQMISKNMNISPTLEIRPGYRFNVMVIKDMTFQKPYKSFDY